MDVFIGRHFKTRQKGVGKQMERKQSKSTNKQNTTNHNRTREESSSDITLLD